MATEYCLFGLSGVAAACWPSSEWAAWVQALGSIAAIVSAAWLVWWQQRTGQEEALRDRHRDEQDKVSALGGLLCVADGMLSGAYNAADSLANFDGYRRAMLTRAVHRPSTMLEALNRTPVEYATTPELLLHFIEARKSFGIGISIIQDMGGSVNVRNADSLEKKRSNLADHLTVVHRAYRAFNARADALAERSKR